MPVCAAQIGSVQKGMLVNITSISDFWIQLAGPISKINDSTKVCTDKMTEKPEVDTYCAVVLGEGFYLNHREPLLLQGKFTSFL